MSRRTVLLRLAQVAVAVLVIVGISRALSGQWDEVRRVATSVRIDWPLLLVASAIVVATYLVLVAVWRYVVNSMGGSLRFADAAYVWFVSALARYLGALWQVVALGALAERRGAPALTAAGSAVVMTVVNVLTGFGVVLATGAIAADMLGARAYAAIILGVTALVAAPFAAPRLSVLAGKITGRPVVVPRLPMRAIWAGALGSVLTWFTYGIAFHVLTYAVLGHAPGGWLVYVSIYTSAYLAGLLGLVPAGLGVAELSMIAAFSVAGILTPGERATVAVVSRLWRTVLEISPGLVMVLVRGKPRVP